MARKRKQANSVVALVAIGLCVYAVTTIGNASDAFLSSLADNVVGLQLGIASATVVIVLLVTVRPRLAKRRVLRKATQIVDHHVHQLAKRRAQLIRQDAYGKELRDKWHHEVAYFLSEHVRPSLNAREQSILDDERNLREMAQRIESAADSVNGQSEKLYEFSPSMSPTAYEALCAEELRQNGWDARLTPTTGDQGVDVVAERRGVRVVLQCKLYSASVGNAAVQEIVAAKAYERASHAAVVSNSPYTSAAQQLARVNNVLLLHHSELSRLETLLDLRAKVATAAVEPAPSHGALTAAPLIEEVAVLDSPLTTEPTKVPELLPDTPPTESCAHEDDSGGVLARVAGFWRQLPLISKAILVLLLAFIIVDASANLYIHRSGQAVERHQTYANSRFGYRIKYPSAFTTPKESENADGMTIGDGAASLTLSGANNENGGSTKDYYDAAVGSAPGRIGYEKLGGTWFVVTYETSDTVVYEKMFVGPGSLNAFVLTFPKGQRSKYEAIVTMIEKSFRHGDVRHRH